MNLMHNDLYQWTMAAGYLSTGIGEDEVVFEAFYRDPEVLGIFCGLNRIVELLRNFTITKADLDFLKESSPAFKAACKKDVTERMLNASFEGTLHAWQEGSVVIGKVPLIRVTAPLWQAQLVETGILSILNHDMAIATKASKIRGAMRENSLFEFGTRQLDGPSAVHAARAAFVGGFNATSNVEAARRYGIPLAGTVGHSWTLAHWDPSRSQRACEREAVQSQTGVFGAERTTVLVDTFNVLNAVEDLRFGAPMNLEAIRIDSGDLNLLPQISRRMLNAAGYTNTKILVSGDIDESTPLSDRVDGVAIGSKLVRLPSLGIVYKMAQNRFGPLAKISMDEPGKATVPGVKQVWIQEPTPGRRVYALYLESSGPKTGRAGLAEVDLDQTEFSASEARNLGFKERKATLISASVRLGQDIMDLAQELWEKI